MDLEYLGAVIGVVLVTDLDRIVDGESGLMLSGYVGVEVNSRGRVVRLELEGMNVM